MLIDNLARFLSECQVNADEMINLLPIQLLLRSKMSRSKFIKVLFLAAIALVLIIYINNYLFKSSNSRYVMLNNYVANESAERSSKVVLFWTKYFDIKFWGMNAETYHEEFLLSINCPKTNCIFTHNKNFMNHPEKYDAIVFHGAEKWFKVDLPKTRSPNQLYIIATKE